MSALSTSCQEINYRNSTDVSPEDEPLYVNSLPVFSPRQSTIVTNELFELEEFPSIIIIEQKFDVIPKRKSLIFQGIVF